MACKAWYVASCRHPAYRSADLAEVWGPRRLRLRSEKQPLRAEDTSGTALHLSTAGCELRVAVCYRWVALGRVPHQPRVKGFGGEHGQDHNGAEGESADPGLDRDHPTERDQRPMKRTM